tara:strand:+ start:535 stop:834 length:300 start_codon:yes stop_codon:yes gene_type:complete
MLKLLKEWIIPKVEPLNPSGPVKPYITVRANNALFRAFIERGSVFRPKYDLTVGEFLQIMSEETDKRLLRISNFGKISLERCRKIEPKLRKRVEAFNDD